MKERLIQIAICIFVTAVGIGSFAMLGPIFGSIVAGSIIGTVVGLVCYIAEHFFKKTKQLKSVIELDGTIIGFTWSDGSFTTTFPDKEIYWGKKYPA